MKDLIIVADTYDNEFYHVYELANDKPWRKLFTVFVDDIEPLFGIQVSQALFSAEYGSTQVKFQLPEAEEVEAL